MIGEILWTPPADLRESTEVGRYLNWLRDERDQEFGSYDALWRWSVDDLEGFWASIWEFYGLRAHAPYERVLGARDDAGRASGSRAPGSTTPSTWSARDETRTGRR